MDLINIGAKNVSVSSLSKFVVKPALAKLANGLGELDKIEKIVFTQSRAITHEKEALINESHSYSLNSLMHLASIAQSRSASLTSHISIMMGATVFFSTRLDDSNFAIALCCLDIILYAFCMVICLYGTSSISLNSDYDPDKDKDTSHRDLALRFWSLQLANTILTVAIAIFTFIVVYHLITSVQIAGEITTGES